MHRDIKELLIGGGRCIVLFDIALVLSPAFALFIERYFFSHLRMAWELTRGVFLSLF